MNFPTPAPAGTCTACGAPLAAPAATFQRCPYCQATLRANVVSPYPVPAAPVAFAPAPFAPSSGLRFGVMFALMSAVPVLIGVVATAGAVLPALRHGHPSSMPTSSTLAVAALATAPLEGWTAIDAPGMVGSFGSFDAIANLGWARGIATTWKPDAALFRVDADRVGSDGKVDIPGTPDGAVKYRFSSAACVAAYKGSTAVVDPKSQCLLHVQIEARDGKPAVEVLASQAMGEPDRPIKDPSCSLARSFAALQSAKALLPRPVYNASIYDFAFDKESDSPRWTFHTVIGGQGDIPDVNATTCVVAGHEPPPALAATNAPAPVKPGPADEPVELTWTGRITSSKGEAPRAGASCTLTANVVPSGDAVESKRTLLVCAGQTVYDSAVPLIGVANAFFTLEEKPVAGPTPSYVYQLGAEDIGPRSGPRAQLMVFTPKGKLDAYREGSSAFHVHVAIAASSVARQGKPLLAETLNAAPVAAAAPPSAQPKSRAAVSSAHNHAARGIRR